MYVIEGKHFVGRGPVRTEVKSYWTGTCFGARHLATHYAEPEDACKARRSLSDFNPDIPYRYHKIEIVKG